MNLYLMATAVGGVMENPGFDYRKFAFVSAPDEETACKTYTRRFSLEYWSPEVMAKVENGRLTVRNQEIPYCWVKRLEHRATAEAVETKEEKP